MSCAKFHWFLSRPYSEASWLATYFMISSYFCCARPALIFATATCALRSEVCGHHARLHLPVSVCLLPQMAVIGRAGGGSDGKKKRWSKKRQRKRRVRMK